MKSSRRNFLRGVIAAVGAGAAALKLDSSDVAPLVLTTPGSRLCTPNEIKEYRSAEIRAANLICNPPIMIDDPTSVYGQALAESAGREWNRIVMESMINPKVLKS